MEIRVTIKPGDKLKAIEYYSSYGANEQETEYILKAKMTPKGLKLFQENGKEFAQGINSGYQFFLIK